VIKKEIKMNEPVALRYEFDGHGYLYMDAGSGSDWASRVKNCEFLYTHPQKELTDEEIIEISHKALEQSGLTKKTNFMVVFARAIIKASRGEK
jgi:hypothetical protein